MGKRLDRYAESISGLGAADLQAEFSRQNEVGPFAGGILGRKRGILDREVARRHEVQAQSIFDLMDEQAESASEYIRTPEDRGRVARMKAEARYARLSGNIELGAAFLADQKQWLDAQEDQRLKEEAATAGAADARLAGSEKLRTDMYNELNPIQSALDSFRSIAEITEVNSPFALTAAAYKTITLLQDGDPRISDADVRAAQTGVTSWLGWFEQQLASGASGKGFTEEARNGLLAVLDPLAKKLEERAAQIIGRTDAFTSVGGAAYDRNIVFAGLDPSLYQRQRYTPSPMPDAATIAARRAETDAAIRSQAERFGDIAGSAVRAFFGGVTGYSERLKLLEDLEAGRVQLTPEALSRLEELGGVEGVRRELELRNRAEIVRQRLGDRYAEKVQ